jgi:ribosomal protein S13
MLKEIKHLKGRRIIFNLPLNGQRTHTNAQTVRKLLKKI